LATGQTPSGDCTLTASGVISCQVTVSTSTVVGATSGNLLGSTNSGCSRATPCIADSGVASSNFATLSGNQTVTGNKTFTGTTIIGPSLSITGTGVTETNITLQAGTGQQGQAIVKVFPYSNSGTPVGEFSGFATRGTVGSPSVVQAGDLEVALAGYGWNDSSWGSKDNGAILVVADQNYTGSNQPTNLIFRTTQQNTTASQVAGVMDGWGTLALGYNVFAQCGNAFPTTNSLIIANSTAPAASVTGAGILFVQGGALKYRGTSGTVTTIANP
jgi:hypothetical protein